MSVVETPKSQGLVARVIGILLHPLAEWQLISAESASVPGLFLGYAAILAAIPALAAVVHGLIPFCLFGVCVTPNPIFVVVGAVVGYIASLASVFVIGFIIDALATSFGGQKNQEQAMKVAVYSWTAAWVGGIFNIVPWIGWLPARLVGLYSLYLLYTGLPALMKSPPGPGARLHGRGGGGLAHRGLASWWARWSATVSRRSGRSAALPAIRRRCRARSTSATAAVDLNRLRRASSRWQQQAQQQAQSAAVRSGGARWHAWRRCRPAASWPWTRPS